MSRETTQKCLFFCGALVNSETELSYQKNKHQTKPVQRGGAFTCSKVMLAVATQQGDRGFGVSLGSCSGDPLLPNGNFYWAIQS